MEVGRGDQFSFKALCITGEAKACRGWKQIAWHVWLVASFSANETTFQLQMLFCLLLTAYGVNTHHGSGCKQCCYHKLPPSFEVQTCHCWFLSILGCCSLIWHQSELTLALEPKHVLYGKREQTASTQADLLRGWRGIYSENLLSFITSFANIFNLSWTKIVPRADWNTCFNTFLACFAPQTGKFLWGMNALLEEEGVGNSGCAMHTEHCIPFLHRTLCIAPWNLTAGQCGAYRLHHLLSDRAPHMLSHQKHSFTWQISLCVWLLFISACSPHLDSVLSPFRLDLNQRLAHCDEYVKAEYLFQLLLNHFCAYFPYCQTRGIKIPL